MGDVKIRAQQQRQQGRLGTFLTGTGGLSGRSLASALYSLGTNGKRDLGERIVDPLLLRSILDLL